MPKLIKGLWDLYFSLVASKLDVEPQLKKNKTHPSTTIKIYFVNKGIEMINLPNILHNDTLFSAFPNHIAGKYEPPTVIYTLSNTINSTLFNFIKFVKDLNLEAFNDDNSILPCEYEGSHHKHICSGDVKSIVTNVQLKDLFLKGPQYREPVSIDMKKAKDEIILSIDQLIKQWSTTKKDRLISI